MNRQFPLMLSPKQAATLENYIQGNNAQALSDVKICTNQSNSSYLYLWGKSGTGKTHLATAAAKAADQNGQTAAYIPLSLADDLKPDMLAGIEHMGLVCLDDINTIAGDQSWEEALFHLFNRTRDQATKLIVTANCGPTSLEINLPDLVSRLTSGVSYHLTPLDDETKMKLLVDRAERRGMELTPDTANYILKNYSRDTASLLIFLDKLDHASLAAQRKLTIPFVRSLITPQK